MIWKVIVTDYVYADSSLTNMFCMAETVQKIKLRQKNIRQEATKRIVL